MKITKQIRVLILILALAMVLPLFACSGNDETTITNAPEQTENTTESGTASDAKETSAPTHETQNTEATEEQSSEATTETTAETTAETTSESVSESTSEETSETASETTSEDTSEDTSETTEKTPIKECEHTDTQDVAAKAATCVSTGNEAYKLCKDCGKMFNAAGEEISAIPETAIDANAHGNFATVEAVAPTCIATGNVAYKQCELCEKKLDPETDAVIENIEVAIDANAHGNFTTVEAVAPTCVAMGNVAYKQCELCEKKLHPETGEVIENTTVAIDANAHGNFTTVDAVAPTCIATGKVAYKQCELCEKKLDPETDAVIENIEVAIDANAHGNFTTVEAVAPTCVSTGNVAYKQCNDCGKKLNPETNAVIENVEIAIDVNAHDIVAVSEKPLTFESVGNEAYTYCSLCEKMWQGETEITEIPVIGYPTEIFFNPDALNGKPYDKAEQSIVTVTNDQTGYFIRYARKAQFSDGTVTVLSGNKNATGQYLVFKYRTNHMTNGQIWADTVNGLSGNENFVYTYTADGKWHIAVIDLAAELPNFVNSVDGIYSLNTLRLDILDSNASSGYMDLAYVILCDDLSEVAFFMTDADKTECTHEHKYSIGNCESKCVVCSENLGALHECVEAFADNADTNVRTYTSACVNCDYVKYEFSIQLGETKPEVLVVPSGMLNTSADRIGSRTISTDGSYLIVNNTLNTADAFITLYQGNKNTVTGQYMLIKYRAHGYAATEWYLGANNGRSYAQGGDEMYLPSFTDGEWQYIIVDLSKANPNHFKAETEGDNAGKYCASYIRWDVMNDAKSDLKTVDIAFVALADDLGDLIGIDNMASYTMFDTFDSSKKGKPEGVNLVTNNLIFDGNHINSIFSQISTAVAPLHSDSENNGLPFAKFTYVGTGEEVRLRLYSGTSSPLNNAGRYIVMLYRASDTSSFNLFLSSNLGSETASGDLKTFSVEADNTWNYYIIDTQTVFSQKGASTKSYYDPETGVTLLSIGFNPGGGKYCDIAFIAMADSPEEIQELMEYYYDNYFSENEAYACDHNYNGYKYGEKTHTTVCSICKAELEAAAAHKVTANYRYDSEKKVYVITCDCGYTFEQALLHTSEANTDTKYSQSYKFESLEENGENFVRYTVNGTAEPFVYIYLDGSEITGDYVLVKYRVTNSATNALHSIHTATTKGGTSSALDGTTANPPAQYLALDTTGEWAYAYVKLSSQRFTASDDGSYTARYIRVSAGSTINSTSFDIALIGFADSEEAIQNYIAANTSAK